ncbi:MAG TPA: hypothetical protein VFJ58_05340 [Armatimonadota bacterium]|nr:hypothetical protein [Armatimonadota bacterium]
MISPLWILLFGYGALMWLVAPATSALASFFGGKDRAGRSPGAILITTSVVASWIFSKSVTNAANLGRDFGLLGGVTYAVYYAGIPICGWLIVRIRRLTGARSLVEYLAGTYGAASARLFMPPGLRDFRRDRWRPDLPLQPGRNGGENPRKRHGRRACGCGAFSRGGRHGSDDGGHDDFRRIGAGFGAEQRQQSSSDGSRAP